MSLETLRMPMTATLGKVLTFMAVLLLGDDYGFIFAQQTVTEVHGRNEDENGIVQRSGWEGEWRSTPLDARRTIRKSVRISVQCQEQQCGRRFSGEMGGFISSDGHAAFYG